VTHYHTGAPRATAVVGTAFDRPHEVLMFPERNASRVAGLPSEAGPDSGADPRSDVRPGARPDTEASEGSADRSDARSGDRSDNRVPDATVARLATYLRVLGPLGDRGTTTVSSEELAAVAGVNSAKLRKDLSHLGSYGTRGVGYDVEYLVYQISRELGLTQDWRVVIVGIGNLGHALANYGGFASRGFTVAALLDADQRRVGERVAGLVVRSAEELEQIVREQDVHIAVVATPAESAQGVCDRLVAAGVTSVLNFAPCVLDVPDHVMVRKVDLSTELQILAFHEQRRVATHLAVAAPVGLHGAGLDGAELDGASEAVR
jgi:redox-sensing transcriptional repressor